MSTLELAKRLVRAAAGHVQIHPRCDACAVGCRKRAIEVRDSLAGR